MPTDRKLSVFVSSTSEDLKGYRAVARLAILDVDWMPVMMEHFTALPDPTVSACCKKLGECELMVLLVGFRRGWVPSVEQGGNGTDSVTACELAFARENHIPVLALRADEATWPGNLWERDQVGRDWIDHFRANLNLSAPTFDFEKNDGLPVFRAKLLQALLTHKESFPPKNKRDAAGLDYFDSTRQGIADGDMIPFVGSEVYGDGPLSPQSLARALGAEACGDQSCLATVSEYQEQCKKRRDRFLRQFREEILKQTAQRPGPPHLYRMLLEAKPPPLIVSATWDFQLEDMLRAQGKSFVLVSHVLRSPGAENDGKILVSFKDQINFFPADQVDLPQADYILYKLLGSPLLPDPSIDTVVVTETDHALLLGRLENKSTGLPTRFSRLLQLGLVLFLGYGLDAWPYRLVMQIFRSIGADLKTLAVRDAVSPVEEAAWKKLGTDLIDMDIDTFAKRVRESFANETGRSAHAR